MDCTDIKAMLSGLVDGELDRSTRHEAERHLAQCAACRDALSNAERLSDLIVADAALLGFGGGSSASLPGGFEDAVLNQTVLAGSIHPGRRWITWTGWVAAAASLGLAAMIWFIDNQPGPGAAIQMASDTPLIDRSPRSIPAGYLTRGERSWTFDGPVSPDALHIPLAAGNTVSNETILGSSNQQIDEAFIDEDAIVLEALPPSPPALEDLTAAPAISRDDAQTLYAASLLLEMLAEADLTSFADLDRIREIAEYDDIPARLAEARQRLGPADKPAVLAAESILRRIVRGPIDLNDLRGMNKTVASHNLPAQINAISNRWQPPDTL